MQEKKNIYKHGVVLNLGPSVLQADALSTTLLRPELRRSDDNNVSSSLKSGDDDDNVSSSHYDDVQHIFCLGIIGCDE